MKTTATSPGLRISVDPHERIDGENLSLLCERAILAKATEVFFRER